VGKPVSIRTGQWNLPSAFGKNLPTAKNVEIGDLDSKVRRKLAVQIALA